MPNTANLFERLKTGVFNKYSGDASKMLLHLGTLGWILSAIAQVCAIVKNDEVPANQKKFLIPQEIADAGINITSFYIVTRGIQNFTRKLAASGFIKTPAIEKFCSSHNIKLGKWSTDISKDIENVITKNKDALDIGGNNLNAEGQKLCKNTIDEYNKFNEEHYEKFESGIKIVGNVIGAVISSNIITPMLRNPIAAMRQKTALASSMHAKNPIVQPVTTTSQHTQDKKTQISSANYTMNTYKSNNLKV